MKKSIPLILIFVALIVLWSVYGKIMNPSSEATATFGEYKVAKQQELTGSELQW